MPIAKQFASYHPIPFYVAPLYVAPPDVLSEVPMPLNEATMRINKLASMADALAP